MMTDPCRFSRFEFRLPTSDLGPRTLSLTPLYFAIPIAAQSRLHIAVASCTRTIRGMLPGKRMRGAAVAGVVGAESHFHHIQNAVRDLPVGD